MSKPDIKLQHKSRNVTCLSQVCRVLKTYSPISGNVLVALQTVKYHYQV